MGMPAKLKNMNVFNDGASYLGLATEVTLPKLGRSFEEYRAGGMDAPIKVDMGGTALEMETKLGGIVVHALRQFGSVRHDAVMLRFAGAYQDDATGLVQPVEVVVRGRHEEIDMGGAKPGDGTEHTVKSALSYYKLIVNGRTEIEIDVPNMKMVVDGTDILAAQRAAIGL